MTPMTDDRQELEALADLIAHCRDSARARGEATLAYHLDMACAAAHGDSGRDDDASRDDGASPHGPPPDPFSVAGSGERRPLDLATIRTAIEGCLDRAQDLDRRILDYTLGMALLAAREAIGTRTYS